MSNKRSLKKNIRYICGDVAAECITSSYLIPGVNKEILNSAVIKTAGLQTSSLSGANVAFDKTPSSFDNIAEYRKARKAYYSAAYKALIEKFNKQLQEIVKEMNSALPKKEN